MQLHVRYIPEILMPQLFEEEEQVSKIAQKEPVMQSQVEQKPKRRRLAERLEEERREKCDSLLLEAAALRCKFQSMVSLV